MRWLALALAVLATPAVAEPVCGSRAEVVETLAGQFSETLMGAGLSQGVLLELWTAEGGKTWTLVVTSPEGKTCIATAGANWVTVKQKFGPEL